MSDVVPKKRKLYRYAVDTFIELLNEVQERYKPYKCNDQDVRSWNLFVDYYDEKIIITEAFVRDFILYGIQSWFNPDMNALQRHNVRFSWVIGTKQIQRYNAMPADVNKRCVRKLKQSVEIKIKDNTDTSQLLKSTYLSIRPAEEKIKSEFFNGKRGLSWCVANTSLYHHRSSYCASCVYKDECREILKTNYSKIYKIRGYDK